jgi:hypothetical protein
MKISGKVLVADNGSTIMEILALDVGALLSSSVTAIIGTQSTFFSLFTSAFAR